MDRKKFITNTLAAGAGVLAASGMIRAKNIKVKHSDYDRMKKQVGFNHLPTTNDKAMDKVIHKADSRGRAYHGWLDSRHTFSFAQYYNPSRMNFGVLRVLNDDVVKEGKGFQTHPHDNMEIISIPLSGDLEHKDSMGNVAVIREGDIQVMSAGTGVLHSEYNKNRDKEVQFLQIWVFPNKKDVEPRYDQVSLDAILDKNTMTEILSPRSSGKGVWIHQDAWFSMGTFDKDTSLTYTLNKEENGVYAFVIEGDVEIRG